MIKDSFLYMVCFVMVMVAMPAHARSADTNTIRAVQAINQDQWAQAQSIIAADNDPLGVKLYQWLYLTRIDDIAENQPTMLAQFIRNNPHWPRVSSLRTTFEKNMPPTMRPKEISAWFDDYPPRTARGMQQYVDALVGQGRTADAKAVLSKWWAQTSLSKGEQIEIYQKYAPYIDTAAHKKRFDTLLYKRQYTNARAVARVLGADYNALAEARIALAGQKSDANARVAAVPARLKNDAGLLYERIRWRRRQNMNAGVVELLKASPSMKNVPNSREWWRERHIMARRFIEDQNYRAAYDMAKGHGHSEGIAFAEGEFLAGWLSLRFLQKPDVALRHFTKLYGGVRTPISKARGAYWAGRAAQDLRDTSRSVAWFNKAAKYQTTFYGQLAAAELGGGRMTNVSLNNAAPPPLSDGDKANFNADDLIRAANILRKAGETDVAGDFLDAFIRKNTSPKAYHFAALTANEWGLHNKSVIIAKKATKEGLFLTAQSYPLLHRQMRGMNTEMALVHAIIRQESQFDLDANSPAGALGLMQLMPGTARETAGKMSMAYSRGRLTTDAGYNIALGSEYLSRMVARFNGSYPLAIASYNAGPGRTDRWIKQFGDPRTGAVDLIDWIELIPISETRNYVQRVMEGVYVYRLRLKNIQPTPHTQIHVAMR